MALSTIAASGGDLTVEVAVGEPVWRVGFAPDPWAWTPWEYAHEGRFAGRWDDPAGVWRTLYVGENRLACFLEVHAPFRPDPFLVGELTAIDEDLEDAAEHPSAPAGAIPVAWAERRVLGQAHLTGTYIIPADAVSLATLREHFLGMALRFDLPDLDAAAIRIAEPRALTQSIAAFVYEQVTDAGGPVAGVRFDSRHGDDQRLWAVFERPGDSSTSRWLRDTVAGPIDRFDSELVEAMQIHRLHWGD